MPPEISASKRQGRPARNAAVVRVPSLRKAPAADGSRQLASTRLALTMIPPPRPEFVKPSASTDVAAPEVVTQTGIQRDVDRPTLLPVPNVQVFHRLAATINVSSLSVSCIAAHFKSLQVKEMDRLLKSEPSFDSFRKGVKNLPGSIELASLRELFGILETDILPCEATG